MISKYHSGDSERLIFNGGDYLAIRWIRLSDGQYAGATGFTSTTLRVRCVR